MIEGKTVYIKPFETLEEVIMHAKLYNDISERSIHDHTEKADVEQRIESFKKGNYESDKALKYMIFNKEDEFLGTIGYVQESPFEINVGYRLMKSKHRQKGYLSEALPLFVTYIFNHMPHIDRLSLRTAYDNIGSQKVALRSGFTFEGALRKAYEYRGNRVDFHVYSILREEFENSITYQKLKTL